MDDSSTSSPMDWNAYTNRLFQLESGGNPNAVTGSNRGLGQFSPDLEAKYGITDANRADPNAQAQAVQRLGQDNAAAFQNKFGRQPTPGELYLMHQQGVAGGPALIGADASTPAWQAIRPYYKSDAMAQKAITGNIPQGHALYGQDPNNVSAGDFRNLWVNKFNGSAPATAGAPAAAAAPNSSPGTDASAAPVDLRPLTPPAPLAGPETFGDRLNNSLGMIDPNKLATAGAKYGPGMGMLNQQQSNPMNNPEVQAMLAPSRPMNGTPMSQMMKQQILASIFKR